MLLSLETVITFKVRQAASSCAPLEMFLKARKMVTCGKRPLMILTCLCSSLSLGFLVVAVGTDYWLYTAEYVMLPNKTLDVSVEVHSGLWRVCPIMEQKVLSPRELSPPTRLEE
uniref:Uncharacterized protein n=1 Tax=Branchiostoma floridae TaxID=7739 RepID=C3Z7N1_BRAFL|eukprot:XP_002595374.1 hypothetical protein BRAFLDRAFT_69203 [Branchiostoma floridae]